MAVKDDSGLPWGANVRPFTPLGSVVPADAMGAVRETATVAADAVARCSECYAVISRHCAMQYRSCVHTASVLQPLHRC